MDSRPSKPDEVVDLSDWQPIASGQAELRLSRDENGDLRLDYDFKGGGGFVVARKPISLALPAAYASGFKIRGQSPANNLELKLVDPSGKNVWRRQWQRYDFPADWRKELVRSREMEFAWGPAGGGPARDIGAVEIVIAAGPGGRGTVWISDLRFQDLSLQSPPRIDSSSAAPGHPAECAFDQQPDTSWRVAADAREQRLTLDFQQQHEYGGMVIEWEPEAPPRSFEVQKSDDGNDWTTIYAVSHTGVPRSYVYLPGGESRCLRLAVQTAQPGGAGIVAISVETFEFSRSIDDFFHNIAAREPTGRYPKYWCRRQTYWTPVGVADGVTRALINEEGLVEVDEGSFSVEPFLHLDGAFVSWADAAVTQQLEDDRLPIPSTLWRIGELTLQTTAFAARVPAGDGDPAVLFLRYRIRNHGAQPRSLRLLLALRPFQVTPPWQKFRKLGGVSAIDAIDCGADGVVVDGGKTVWWDDPPAAVGAAGFDQKFIDLLAAGEVPIQSAVRDPIGYASAALRYDVDLGAGEQRDYRLAVALNESRAGAPVVRPPSLFESGDARFEAAVQDWRRKLGALDIRLPEEHQGVVDSLVTAAGHILINRDGPALQPGPRRYTRSWIRDGAIMGAALLRLGCDAEMRDFIVWYARHQRADGYVPCCVDRDGVDPLVEHDSHGQLIYAVMEYFRATGDRGFLAEMWPISLKAIDYMELLRNSRLTPEFQSGERRACYGLLPESASHEGYLAHPVHSYWDDFWALRGLAEGAAMAEVLGETAAAARISALYDAFRETLDASIRVTIAERGIPYVPGSVEWADFDPTATSNAVSMLGQAALLPVDALAYTYQEYLRGFRDKHAGRIDWNNYTAYEIRIIGALVHLGERDSALELLEFFLADRRPRAWNQWPEITWRDPESPGHQGDLPHTWIGAEYILSVLSLFAFERAADQSLVIGAGIAPAWVEGAGGVRVRGLRTGFGTLDFDMERPQGGPLRVELGGRLQMPPGGLVLRPPVSQPLTSMPIVGASPGQITEHEIRIYELPCVIAVGASALPSAHPGAKL